jgi:hypothetical protein
MVDHFILEIWQIRIIIVKVGWGMRRMGIVNMEIIRKVIKGLMGIKGRILRLKNGWL